MPRPDAAVSHRFDARLYWKIVIYATMTVNLHIEMIIATCFNATHVGDFLHLGFFCRGDENTYFKVEIPPLKFKRNKF